MTNTNSTNNNNNTTTPLKGEIYSLKSVHYKWTGTDLVECKHTEGPVRVLILNNGNKTNYGDHLFKCVPVIPRAGGVWETDIQGGSYLVSTSQLLLRSEGEVFSEEEIGKTIAALRERWKELLESDTQIEEEQFSSRVIPANADARWDAWKGGKRLRFCYCGKMGVEGGRCRHCGYFFSRD